MVRTQMWVALAAWAMPAAAQELPRIPAATHNLLVDARISSNLESFDKGLRGARNHMIFDTAAGRFVEESQWHEYGVGFGEDLGVVPEDDPAFWMAEWDEPVEANLIVLTGVYPNQPQPDTSWKIERRGGGEWTTHALGTGGWYDRERYIWGGPDQESIILDGFRISVFSKDDETPVKSIHFRGEEAISWIVAQVAPIDAAISLPREQLRAGREAELSAEHLAGDVTAWEWNFGDGVEAEGDMVTHTYTEPGEYVVALTFSDGEHTSTVRETVEVGSPIEAHIVPLEAPVMVGEATEFAVRVALGDADEFEWDFGDGEDATGRTTTHSFAEPGIYQVTVSASDGKYGDESKAIVRVHTADTLHIPQVVLDTDQKNEQDDQHYFGYGLFSELDLLGVNSVHHGGGQEPINYAEILHVLDLAKQSDLAADREPFIFRGANERLVVPASGRWEDTRPIVTEACEAILAAVRGASPTNPVWVVPVGPGTNAASAILQARAEGLRLDDRLRVMWLGGSNGGITGEFNGNNDPWSMYVTAQSGIETWIVPAPVGARVAIDKRTEGHLYADHALGRYLKEIVPARNKPLFDPSCLSAIIDLRLGLGWIKETEFVTIAGPDEDYRWTASDESTTVRVIREIDQKAMQLDIFETMKGGATKLVGEPAGEE